MNKSQKERAYLRDLNVDSEWTSRFTEVFDKNYKFSGEEESIVYLHAGCGNHVLSLRESLKSRVSIFGVPEDADLCAIASAKATAINSGVIFSPLIPIERFDFAIADASLVESGDLPNLISKAVASSEDRVVFFLPTAGSFGEIFSVLWEACLNQDLFAKNACVEKLVAAVPSISKVEEMAEYAGLKNLKHYTSVEIFEYKNGDEFTDSILISDFLLPVWLEFFDESEKIKAKQELARVIDETRDDMSFRFTVKATMFVGKKQKGPKHQSPK